MGDDALISVVIPVHNGERFICRTLESALSQTYKALEIIVVDDGSTDHSASLIESVSARDNRIRLFRTHNSGVAAARNFGISQARGSFIAPLDADDLWSPYKITRQFKVMRDSSLEVGLVYCWSVEIDEDDFIIPTIRRLKMKKSGAQGRVTSELIKGCFIETGSSPLIKRSCIDAVGGYDDSLRPQGADDWKLYLALSEICEFAVIPEYLVGYRQAKGSVSRNITAMGQSMDNVAQWIFEKRPDLPKDLKHETTYGIGMFMSGRALDTFQPMKALHYRAKALKARPAKLLEAATFAFLARVFLRMIGFKWSVLKTLVGIRSPRTSFQMFQKTSTTF